MKKKKKCKIYPHLVPALVPAGVRVVQANGMSVVLSSRPPQDVERCGARPLRASALPAVFMGHNVRCGAAFPSLDLVLDGPSSRGHHESLSSGTAALCDLAE